MKQSVAHISQRAMIYKTLGTFIVIPSYFHSPSFTYAGPRPRGEERVVAKWT